MWQTQATWTGAGELFFWIPDRSLSRDELPFPEVAEFGVQVERVLVSSASPHRRQAVRGWAFPLGPLLAPLSSMALDQPCSDAVRCWSQATLLALELAAFQRVVPTVLHGDARWKALLSRPQDRERLGHLVSALPVAARAAPTTPRGAIRLLSADVVLRSFLDEAVDALYRQNARPGSARGWIYAFAQALRGEERAFSPREARYQGIADKLRLWADESTGSGLQPSFHLGLPRGRDDVFELSIRVHPADHPELHQDVRRVWTAGRQVQMGEQAWPHPAHHTLRGLARACRIFPPIKASLSRSRPRALKWKPARAWEFLEHGVDALRSAGFEVSIPAEFSEAGTRRIKARMRVHSTQDESGGLDLGSLLNFRWEVVLGDSLLTEEEVHELLRLREPLLRFRGEWVILDPAELARLPEDLSGSGQLPAPEALRAVLTGEYQGVPVVADDHLSLLLEALRRPPPVEAPRGLEGTLRPYQAEGHAWLTTLGRLGLGACLADDMGLGKTVQLIAHLLTRREAGITRPSLVVCPTSVLGNWTREIHRFAPGLQVLRHHGLQRDTALLPGAELVLTTYGLLVRDQEALCDVDWDVVVLDEAQAIKNPDSQRAKAAACLRARHRVALTGTPVENRLDELWSLMNFLVPGLLGPRRRFLREVAVPVERFGDEEMARRLKLGVSPFLLRRLKSDPDIAPDLPEKFEARELCPLTREQAILYEQVVEEHMELIASSEKSRRSGHVLSLLTALKQICNHPAHYLHEDGPLEGRSGKLTRTTELLDTILASGERVLLFTQYRAMGELLRAHLGALYGEEVPFLHGGVLAHKRDEMVAAFQQGEAAPILLVSLKAGGTGLNLTAATHVIHFDRWWNPAVEDQATDRAYRIGQRRDVSVHKMVVQDSLEERIDQMLEDKRALADSIVGGGERWVTALTDEELKQLVFLGQDAVLEEE